MLTRRIRTLVADASRRWASVRAFRSVNASSIARRRLGLAQGRRHIHKRTAQRLVAGTAQDSLEDIVPERDPAISVDDGDALIQGVDDLATPLIFFKAVQLSAVRTVDEIQRYGGYRQNFPHPPVDHLNESDREAHADDVARTAAKRVLQPRSIDRPSREERRDDLRRRALDDAIRDDRGRERHALPRPCTARRSSEGLVVQSPPLVSPP